MRGQKVGQIFRNNFAEEHFVSKLVLIIHMKGWDRQCPNMEQT